MEPTAPDDNFRHELLVLARKGKKCRITQWTKERPTVWQPTQVKNPESGFIFTEAGAWDFIADLLEAGHPLQSMILDHPPDKIGYVMKVSGGAGEREIYIKLQLGSGKIYGRSFHYSR